MAIEELSWADLELKATTEEGPFGDHLYHQFQLLLDNSVLKDELKGIVSTGSYSNEEAREHLSRAGLIKISERSYVLRCGLYKRYFKSRL